MVDEDTTQFPSMESWKGGGNKLQLTYNQIVFTSIQRTMICGSVEFMGGYWENKFVGNLTTRVYIPNSRDVYNNSVRQLRALLYCNYDEKMTEADKQIQERLKQIKEEYNKNKGTNKEENDKAISEYDNEKVNIYIELFTQLVMLAKRLNFLEEQGEEIE